MISLVLTLAIPGASGPGGDQERIDFFDHLAAGTRIFVLDTILSRDNRLRTLLDAARPVLTMGSSDRTRARGNCPSDGPLPH